MAVHNFERNNDFNFKIKDACLSIPCHSRAQPRESRNIEANSNWMLGSSPSMTKEGNRCTNMTNGNNALSIIPQSGRSMVEMLGVLAVIGVLSIGGIMGYSYGMDKIKANKIMQDVELAYISATSQNNREDGILNEASFTPSSGYPTYTELLFDTDKNIDIVLVKSVPKSVCELVLEMVQNTNWIVSSVEIDTNYLYKIEECTEQNAMVFSLSEVDGFVYECDKECPENRMCNVDDECICAYGYTPDTNGECQEIQCNEITEVACTLDRGERWCCPYDTFCGDRIGLCIPFEGFCVYRFYDNSNEGISYTTDCSYIVGSTDVIEKYETDCSYIVTGKTPNINLSANKQCPDSNQYCVLKWSKDRWGSNEKEPTLSGPESGTIYGKCQMMSVFDTMPIVTYYEGGRIVYPHINCQEQGQYCVLKWSKDSWGSNEKEPTLSGPESGTIYGKCQMMSVFDSDPIIKSTDIDNTTYRIEKDCPTKQYCHLQWKNENCNTISGNATGLIYGVCADMNEKNNVCPISNNN